MKPLKYSEMIRLEDMLKGYLMYCSEQQSIWRKSASYHSIFKTWEVNKQAARNLVDKLLEHD